MNLTQLKKFAQGARRKLLSEVSSRLDYLTGHDDPYIRAHQAELAEIRRRIDTKSREQLIEEVAYTWFNRIVALRYMDLRGYTNVRLVSPQAGQVQPELLFQIKQGRTPKELRPFQSTFDGYLDGSVRSDQPDREIYTVALLGMCNEYSRTLPFLFRKVDEFMAVLLPRDLLSESSIIAEVQRAITEDEVQDVEVIGWLYQFYISEKKDQVFGRPKGEKIKKEDIPAATQLFTPHWIVRYMVENSLGRLWRNNRPDTGLNERMEYYIEGDPEPEYLTVEGPEEITLLDPACGSGHILAYAFDLLYGMYEETGYSAEEIPSLILTNNLYGIDIDTRAAELASFALTMKAREKDRFFFKRGVVPRVIAMEDVSVDLREADIRMSPQLQEAFGYLSEATNFGSLIPVGAEVQGEIEELLADLDARGDADLFA
ncbi:MAG: DNA methyltransferase, partial [Alkalispirochaetaceae bacterium]